MGEYGPASFESKVSLSRTRNLSHALHDPTEKRGSIYSVYFLMVALREVGLAALAIFLWPCSSTSLRKMLGAACASFET